MRFRQVDVFAAAPLLGNPVAVVHDADGLSEDQMAAFARWTNLSETTFLLAPTLPGVDYRLRIFTAGGELPFAGHPPSGARTPGWRREESWPAPTWCRSAAPVWSRSAAVRCCRSRRRR